MPDLCDRLTLLKGAPEADVAVVLADALAHAGPDERLEIARALVATGLPSALQAVLDDLHRLGAAGREILAQTPASLSEVVGSVLKRQRPKTTLAVLDVIEERADPELLAPVVDLLLTGHGRIAERAAQTLLATVSRRAGPLGRWRPVPPAAAMIDLAVSRALDGYRDHRFDEVLLAGALLAVRPGPHLARLLAQEDHPAVAAMRAVADRTRDPLVSGNLINWMGSETMRRAAGRWMHRVDGPVGWTHLLGSAHLLRSPRRRRGMRRVDRPGQCLPAPRCVAALPEPLQARVPDFVASLPLRGRVRAAYLAGLSTLRAPVAKLRTLMLLLGHRSTEARRAAERFCFDPCPAVARLATRACLARGEDPEAISLLVEVERRGHAVVARRSSRTLSRTSVDALFRRLGTLAPPERTAAGLTLMRSRREAMLDRLTAALHQGTRGERLNVIDLVRRLRLVTHFEEELIIQSRSNDPRIASMAIAALGEGASSRRLDALQAGLEHGDARVRANAVEAIGRSGEAALIEMVMPLTAGHENRARANAIRVLLDAHRPAGIQRLRAMLRDSNPLHRVSGVWTARTGRVAAVAPDLRRLIEDDDQPQIRVRAQAAWRLLSRPREQPRRVLLEAAAT